MTTLFDFYPNFFYSLADSKPAAASEHLVLYNHLRIVTSHMNLSFRSGILPSIFFYLVILNILSSYLTLSLKVFDLGDLLFPFMVGETSLGILGLGTMAGLVNLTSTRFIAKVKSRMAGNTNLTHRKVAKACAPLKIRFGSNFVEISTPLVASNFCLRSTVRLLLMYKF